MTADAANLPRQARPAGAHARPRSLPVNSIWLMLGKGLQMGSGFLFWVVAARSAPVLDVGLAAAFISGVMLCTQLGILGTGSAAIVALGRGQSPKEVLDAAFTILLVAASLAGGGYLLVSAFGGKEVAETQTVSFSALFLLAAVTGTAVICLDQISIALHHTEGAASRYTVGGVLSLTVVGIAAATMRPLSAATLLACWTVGSVAAVVVGLVQCSKWAGYRYRPTLHLSHLRGMLRIGVPNQMLTLTERLSPALVPIILAHAVSPRMTAYWYPAWMMAWVVFTVPISVGMVQFADLVRRPDRTREIVRSAFTWSLALGGAMSVVLVLGAGLFLRLLGSEYADAAVGALRVLAIGVVPYVVLQVYNAVCRARNRLVEATTLGAVLTVAICVSTALAGGDGTLAVAVWWLVCTSVAALVALVRLQRITAATARPSAAGAPEHTAPGRHG